jgi:hypothetical protein
MRVLHGFGLAISGLTLNLDSSFIHYGTARRWHFMIKLIQQVLRWIPAGRQVARNEGVAGNLLERAEARAGLNPLQALELRRAALAYLRVVR